MLSNLLIRAPFRRAGTPPSRARRADLHLRDHHTGQGGLAERGESWDLGIEDQDVAIE